MMRKFFALAAIQKWIDQVKPQGPFSVKAELRQTMGPVKISLYWSVIDAIEGRGRPRWKGMFAEEWTLNPRS